MKGQAEDIIRATTKGWMEGYSLDRDYQENIFLAAKKSDLKTQNMLVLVYKLRYENTFTDYYGNSVPVAQEYYFYVNWDNFCIYPDGTCEYDLYTYWKSDDKFSVKTNVVKDKYGSQMKLSFTGEENIQNIYDMYITSNSENYRYEVNYVR